MVAADLRHRAVLAISNLEAGYTFTEPRFVLVEAVNNQPALQLAGPGRIARFGLPENQRQVPTVRCRKPEVPNYYAFSRHKESLFGLRNRRLFHSLQATAICQIENPGFRYGCCTEPKLPTGDDLTGIRIDRAPGSVAVGWRKSMRGGHWQRTLIPVGLRNR